MKSTWPDIPWDEIELVEPPGSLDERIARLIAAAETHHSAFRRGAPPWTVALACAASLVLGFAISHLTMSRPRHELSVPAVIIEIPADALSPGFFVVQPERNVPFFERQFSAVEIHIPKADEESSL